MKKVFLFAIVACMAVFASCGKKDKAEDSTSGNAAKAQETMKKDVSKVSEDEVIVLIDYANELLVAIEKEGISDKPTDTQLKNEEELGKVGDYIYEWMNSQENEPSEKFSNKLDEYVKNSQALGQKFKEAQMKASAQPGQSYSDSPSSYGYDDYVETTTPSGYDFSEESYVMPDDDYGYDY